MIGVDDGAKKAFVPAAANDVMNLNGEAGAGNATTGGNWFKSKIHCNS